MNLLLDTHIALWALNDDPSLSEKAKELILDPDNTIYYSMVSVWEVLLKHSNFFKNRFLKRNIITYSPRMKRIITCK